MRRGLLLATASFLALGLQVRAEPLPADSGMINVRDYGARGNGRDDDTAALQKAIQASGEDTGRAFWQDRIVYLPDGTYRVSATLMKRYASGGFGSGLILMGQSRRNTIIRLADRAAGFGDPLTPRAVIYTTSKQIDGTPTSGGKDYVRLGEGNDAYMNFVEDLTIDVGSGNAGAIAVDYLANNMGAVRNVTLTAQPDSGAVGLSMIRKWPGPALIQNVSVQGFAVGIQTGQTEYGLTFDHITLLDQRQTALINDQNSLAIHDLRIRGPAPAIVNAAPKGFIALDDAVFSLSGGAAGIASAVDNKGIGTFRRVRFGVWQEGVPLSSYGPGNSGIQQGRQWTPTQLPAWLPSPEDAPALPTVQLPEWANAQRYGAVADPTQDSTEGLRRAFASGAAVIYLPHGSYAISDALEVPASVQRIVGMTSTIKILPSRKGTFARTSGIMRVMSGGGPLTIERVAFDNTDQGFQLAVEVSGARDVTLRDIVSAGVTLLDRKADGGRVFLENVCCGKMQTAGAAPVFARQLDTEGTGTRILNSGTPLWILGLKTEGVSTLIENRDGARTDLFGGLVYMVRPAGGAPPPAFRNSGAWLAASFAEESLRKESRYSTYVVNEANETMDVSAFPERGYGRIVPSLVAQPKH